ncbi:Hypothetical predicted protein [Prunus dulcis]|uniref:Uncharacterized protein n=1 Tax=Prunus dulcis TaxID=3755 RepID=A0A5E4G992_PRUDU|nr:Hypothetical predicted protein [Prunus dulcis]
MYYYWPYNEGIVDLDQIRIPVLWTELDVAFHSLGSEKAKGKGWVAPLFRGTAVVTEHRKDERAITPKTFACLEASGGSRSTTGEQSQPQPLQSRDARADRNAYR